MIPFDEAYKIVISAARQLGVEDIELSAALGRILADDVTADLDMPPFNKSAMDGYACHRSDLMLDLTVIETIAAGVHPSRAIAPGECAKIMTGAMVPDGADCVVMVEMTESVNASTIRFTGRETDANICYRGEDIRKGDTVLRKGDRILPQHAAVLATVGCIKPRVTCRPRVAVLATGSEIVEPAERPGPAQIRNSNSSQLCAQISLTGLTPKYLGIADDTTKSIGHALNQASRNNDVILVSGGVSAGDFDLVPDIMRENGFEILFQKVAVKPGMPIVFGIRNEVYCFGLPGNPVSTFVIFEILVKPFLFRLMGHNFQPPASSMKLAKPIVRRKTDRDSWIPVRRTDQGSVEAIEYHGSAHLTALTESYGLICVPHGVSELKEGTSVDVRQI